MVQNCLGFNPERPYLRRRRKKENLFIHSIPDAVVQWRLRNVQKGVMHVQSCCFAKENLLLLSFALPSPSSCLNSFLLWSRNVATMVTWRHTSYWYASNFIFNITRNNWTPLCLYCHFGQITVWFWLLKWEQHAVSVTSQSWMFSYGTVFWKDQGATAFYLVSEWINTFLPHALKSYAFHFQSIGLRPSLRSFNIQLKSY